MVVYGVAFANLSHAVSSFVCNFSSVTSCNQHRRRMGIGCCGIVPAVLRSSLGIVAFAESFAVFARSFVSAWSFFFCVAQTSLFFLSFFKFSMAIQKKKAGFSCFSNLLVWKRPCLFFYWSNSVDLFVPTFKKLNFKKKLFYLFFSSWIDSGSTLIFFRHRSRGCS